MLVRSNRSSTVFFVSLRISQDLPVRSMISRLLTRSMMGIALLLRFLFGLLPPRDDRIIDRTFLADRNGFSRLKKLPLLDPSFRQSLNSLLKLFKRARSKFSIISRKKLEQMTTVTISLSPRGMKKNWVARREKQPISPPEPVFCKKSNYFSHYTTFDFSKAHSAP